MPQCLYDRIRFLLRTLGLLRIFGLRLMVVISYLQTAFLLDLRWKRSKRMLPEKLLGNSIQLCGDLPKILIQIQCACTDLIAA